MRAYYEDAAVTLYLGDCREVTEWLAADVLVTDPPYGVTHVSGWDDPARAIRNDADPDTRDAALALWGERPAAVFGSWKRPRPINTRHLVIWDKTDGTGAGMGDLSFAFGHSFEEIYLLGDWPRQGRPRLSNVIRTRSGLRSLSGETGHPTPKPVGLMSVLIGAAPRGTVADPFAGSGSTLVAAKNLGRRAIGVEIDERYCELAARRLTQDVLDFTGDSA